MQKNLFSISALLILSLVVGSKTLAATNSLTRLDGHIAQNDARKVSGFTAKELFDAAEMIAAAEKSDFIRRTNNSTEFQIDSVSCVFENYYACSFMTEVAGVRKMIIATTGAEELIRGFAHAQVPINEEGARLDVDDLVCKATVDASFCMVKDHEFATK